MKKVYYYLFAAIGLVSCSSDDILETADNTPKEIATELPSKEYRSYGEAASLAKYALSMIEDSSKVTRSGEPGRSIDFENGVKAYRQNVTRANGSVGSDTLFYVFNFKDNKGFTIVSKRRAAEGVLAVVEEGNFDPNSNWNGELPVDLETIAEYVSTAKTDSVNVTRHGGHEILDFSKVVPYYEETAEGELFRCIYDVHTIMPKLKVTWGQRGSIARCCPGNIACSGPIALAQIMSFHKWPRHMNLTYFDGRDNYNNWEEMVKYKNPSYEIPTSFFQFPAFIREIGQRTKTNYTNQTTDLAKMREFMISQQYAVSDICSVKTSEDDYKSSIANKLTNMSFIVGQLTSKSGKQQTFVIDGCNYYKEIEEYKHFFCPQYNYYKVNYDTRLIYINWCEGGSYNGYYSVNLIEPGYYTEQEIKKKTNFYEGESQFKPQKNATLRFFSTGR